MEEGAPAQRVQDFKPVREGDRIWMTQGFWRGRWPPEQRHKKRAKEWTCIETYCMPDSELNLSICLFHTNEHTHTHSRDGRSGVSFLYFYPYSVRPTHTPQAPAPTKEIYLISIWLENRSNNSFHGLNGWELIRQPQCSKHFYLNAFRSS